MVLFLDGGFVSAADQDFGVDSMRGYFRQEELITAKITESMDWNQICRYLEEAQAIVLAADVYLDSVSSEVLRFLERVEQAVIGGESIGATFYAILYTELYEGEQTSIAMEVLKNFCFRANITWGRGLGIGAAAVCLLTVEDFLRYTILLGIKCASQGRASTFFVINDVRQVQIWQNPRQNSNMAMTPSPP